MLFCEFLADEVNKHWPANKLMVPKPANLDTEFFVEYGIVFHDGGIYDLSGLQIY